MLGKELEQRYHVLGENVTGLSKEFQKVEKTINETKSQNNSEYVSKNTGRVTNSYFTQKRLT